MLLIEAGIVAIIMVLILVILWSGLTYPGFLRALKLGVAGKVLFLSIILLYLGAVAVGFVLVYRAVSEPLVRGGALLLIPMFMGMPFRMLVAFSTRKWISRKFRDSMIRSASNADIEAVTDLIYTVLQEFGLSPDPDHTDADLKDIEGNYLKKNGSFDVLLDTSGEIIGSVGILRLDEQKCELRKMYLKVSERGKGYGKLLLDHGLENARQLGYKVVILETATVLKQAITLYRQYGFKPYEMENPSPRCDQMYYLDLDN